MPLVNHFQSDSQVTVMCSVCGNVVDDEQLENGRAVCGFCDEKVYGAVPKREPKTMKEIVREAEAEEERQFVRMMRKLHRRLRI